MPNRHYKCLCLTFTHDNLIVNIKSIEISHIAWISAFSQGKRVLAIESSDSYIVVKEVYGVWEFAVAAPFHWIEISQSLPVNNIPIVAYSTEPFLPARV